MNDLERQGAGPSCVKCKFVANLKCKRLPSTVVDGQEDRMTETQNPNPVSLYFAIQSNAFLVVSLRYEWKDT